MRPLRLVLENFGSFRGRHEVDFEGIDLFVLAGPTGAGKSTILDAISCALYSSIARYEQQNLIEPAINKLATQATVSFMFAVGTEQYVVTRLLRRTSTGGAHAAEVRLEGVVGDGETTTLASGSREVADHVQRLLGLTFEEFCRTVVLPQGAFARFLHGGAKERQDLLVRLLGLDVFRTLGQRARVLARGLEAEAASMATQLEELGDVTDAHVAAEEERAAGLAEARRRVVEDLWPALDELKESGASARAAVDEAERAVAAIAAIDEPDEVGDITGRIREADDAVTSTDEALTAARQRLAEARTAAEGLPPREPVAELLRIDEELGTQREAAEELAEKARALAAAAADAATRAEEAERSATEKDRALAELRQTHVAHTLADGLAAGDPCPVCRRPVDDVPDHPEPEGLEEIEAAAERAVAEARRLREDAVRTKSDADRASALAAAATERLGTLTASLADAADACAVALVDGRADRARAEERLEAHRAAAATLTAVEKAVGEAESRRRAAETARRALDDEARAAWAAFGAARDTVAALGAPQPDRDDLAASWKQLVAWASDRLAGAKEELAAANREFEAARTAWQEQAGLIRDAVTAAGLELAPDAQPQAALDALAGAASAAREAAESRRRQLERATKLRERRSAAEAEREVAAMLGDLLRTDEFEQWLLNRLSARLVAGASRTLDELTQGAFSLALDADRGTFEVIDHLNADERRSARTLSGGETFLASLALALALAEHVSHVNQAGATRLDALFLDEGFGTLDPETLETVAAAIEELSGRRMVGVITHVRELAARIPHRFDVSRGPDGSTIVAAPPDATSIDEPGLVGTPA